MAVAFVQGAFDRASSDKATLAPSLTGVTAGNTLVLAITGFRTTSALPTSVSDGVNTWTLVANLSYASATNKALIYLAANVAGGNTTVSATWASNFLGTAHLSEWSGADPIYPGDLISTRTGTDTAPSSNATGAANYEGSVALALLGISSSPNNPIGIDLPSGYTNIHVEQNGADYDGFSLDYKVLTSQSSENPNWGTTTSGSWGSVVFILKPPSPGVNLVQSALSRTTSSDNLTSISVTLNGVTEGNLLVAHLAYIGPSSPPAPPDTVGDGVDTYTTRYFEQMGFFERNGFYYAVASSSGNRTFTVTCSEAMAATAVFMEFSGADPDFPIENLVARSATNTATGVTDPVRATAAHSLVLSAVALNDAVGSPVTLNAPSGYALIRREQDNVNYMASAVACKKVGYPVTENPSWGALGLTADSWRALSVVIKPKTVQVEVVQSATSVSTVNETSRTVTLNDLEAGNRIVVIAASFAGGSQHTVSDTAGNTWVRLNTSSVISSTSQLTTWITKNKVAAGNTTITVSGGGTGRYDIAAIELRNASEFRDAFAQANVTGTSPGTGNTAATTIPNGISIAAYAGMGVNVGADDAVAHQADYTTILDDNGNSDGLHASFCYRIEGEIGVKSCSFSTTNATLTIQPTQITFIPVETPRWALLALGTVATVASGNISPVPPVTTAAGTVTLAAGDLFVAAIGFRSNVAFAAPAGWTIHEQQANGNVSTTTNASIGSGLLASIKRGSANPANTFTRTGGDVARGQILVYRAVDFDDWSFHASSSATLAANATVVTTASLTTGSDLSLIVAAMGGADNVTVTAFDAATDPTVASGTLNTTSYPALGSWTERIDGNTTTGADTTLAVADAVRALAGSTGTIQCTASLSSRHVLAAATFKVEDAVSRTAGVGVITLAGQAAEFTSGGGGTPHTATPGAGALSLAGQTPAAAAASSMSPGAGALTLAGQAPTVAAGTSFSATPGNGSLTLDGFAPSVATAVGATPGSGTISLAGQAPAATTAANVTPGSGALTVAGFAPVVAAGTSFSATPGNGTLTLDGLAATSAGAVGASPGAGALSLAGLAPTVVAGTGFSATPGAGALSLAGLAPTVVAGTSFTATPGVGALSLEGRAPAIAAAVGVLPGAGVLTVAGQASSVSTAAAAAPGAGTISLAGQAPTAAGAVSASPGAGATTVDGFAATVAAGTAFNAAVGNGAIAVAGFAPTVAAAASASPGSNALTLSGQSATLTAAVNASPGTGALTIAGQPPSASAAAEAASGVGSVTVEGRAPTVVSGFSAESGVGALTLSGFEPVLDIGGSFTTQPGSGEIAVNGFAPSIVSGASVTAAAGALTLTGQAVTAEAGQPADVEPGTGALAVEGRAPTSAAGVQIAAAAGAITLAGQAASVAAAVSASPGLGDIRVQGLQAAFASIVSAAPGAGALILEGLAPEVTSSAGDLDLIPGVGGIEIDGFAPLFVTTGADGATLIIEEGPAIRATVAILDIPVRSVVETTASLSAVERPKFSVEIDERREAPRVAIPVGA